MDKWDKYYVYLLNKYKIGKWYPLIEVIEDDMSKLVNRLYIFEKRGYVHIGNKDVYAELNGKPSWTNMSFKLLPLNIVTEYYLKKYKYIPEFLKKEHNPKQLKLDL